MHELSLSRCSHANDRSNYGLTGLETGRVEQNITLNERPPAFNIICKQRVHLEQKNYRISPNPLQ